jgi:hypothetical protein
MKPFKYRLHHDVINPNGIDERPVQVENKTLQSEIAIPGFLSIIFEEQHEIPSNPNIDRGAKSRHPGENRGPVDSQRIEKTGFRLSPE